MPVDKKKHLFVQMFGKFMVYKDGKPIPLSGKTKEILALIMTERGNEISNNKIFDIIWDHMPPIDPEISFFNNSVLKMKRILRDNKISDILISTSDGHMVNTSLFECDYYSWLDRKKDSPDRFNREFLLEYPWREKILNNTFSAQDKNS